MLKNLGLFMISSSKHFMMYTEVPRHDEIVMIEGFINSHLFTCRFPGFQT
jgi:hypothetical protein